MLKEKWRAWTSSLACSPAEMVKLLGVAALYALLAKLFLTFFAANGVISVVWPPSGLALAALLLGGKRYAWGVLLGAFLGNTLAGVPVGLATAIATGNTLEALLGAWLLTRDGKFDPNFSSLRDYLRLFVLAGIFGASVSALIGTTALHVSSFLPSTPYFHNLLHWWMGDAIGIILLTPFILTWRRMPDNWNEPVRVIEAVLVLVLTFFIGQVIFADWFHDTLGQVARGYWMYLFVTWAAVRLGIHGVVAVLLMTSLQALLGAAHGVGFFADDMANTQLANYWFYMAILSVVSMTLATYLNERRQATERLRFVLDNAADAVFVINSLGRYIYVNRMASTMLGYPVEELLTLAITDIVPDKERGVTHADFQQLLKDGRLRKEVMLKRKDGRLAPVELNAVRLPDGNLYAACRDISEQKAVAEHLALFKRQNDLILNAAGEGICGVDTYGTIIFANPAAAKMLGFAEGELFGQSLHAVSHHTRPDGSPYPVADCPILASLNSGMTCHEGDEFFWRKDGGTFPVEYTSTPIVDKGETIGAVVMFSDITHRRQAGETLREWRQFIEYATWGMATGDALSRTIKLANPAFARMHGYTVEEMQGMKVDDLYAPESRPDFQRFSTTLLDAGQLSFECMRLRKDGSTFPAQVDVSIVDGVDGKASYIANVQDITQRRQAEDALHESEELFRTLFNGITDAIFVLPVASDGVPGQFVVVNNVACEWLGYTHQEMLAMSPLDIDAPDTGIDIVPIVKRIAAGESVTFEQILVAKDGRRISVELKANPLLLHGQRAVMTMARDITERKKIEMALRWSEERFRSTFEQAAVGIAHAAPNGAFLWLNQKFCAIVGYPREELMRMSFQDITYPADLDKNLGYMRLALAGEISSYAMEKRYVRKDQTLVWVSLTVTHLRKDDGTPNYSVGVIEDITERKRTEQQLRDLSLHLQTVREEEKASIAREIHDDLGGTLTALKMEAYWLARKLPAEKEMVPLLEHVEAMDALLDSAVVATRRIITELRPTILDDLGLLAALEWQCEQFHKRTGIECRIGGGESMGDAGELDKVRSINLFRIFQEALTNVSRHSGASRVEVELRRSDDEIVLSIGDNGCGLPEGHAIGPASYGMRGMTERVEQLGGRIEFDNLPGGGLKLSVRLPLPAENQKVPRLDLE